MADRQAPPALAAERQAFPGDAGIVCIEERVTGSRHPRKVCHSQQAWNAMKQSGQDATRDLQRTPALPNDRGG